MSDAAAGVLVLAFIVVVLVVVRASSRGASRPQRSLHDDEIRTRFHDDPAPGAAHRGAGAGQDADAADHDAEDAGGGGDDAGGWDGGGWDGGGDSD